MWVNCILRSGSLFVTLPLAIARHKQSSFAASCYLRGTLSQAVDMLCVKAARLKATIPEDHVKKVQLLKKKKKTIYALLCLIMKAPFTRRISSYAASDLKIGKKGIYKAISELDILLSWIKQFLESVK
ncbi:hypothetical protein J1605_008667 [Eschrichtius robustus]|uniref:Uncharacterized protein n=1 Tax=Eschrichtius robustus TaxID=9764 RepID=A0AB34GVV6_ESCRO|nr:hypothetical protein J1605_008667 [Eschrichtius robustus]